MGMTSTCMVDGSCAQRRACMPFHPSTFTRAHYPCERGLAELCARERKHAVYFCLLFYDVSLMSRMSQRKEAPRISFKKHRHQEGSCRLTIVRGCISNSRVRHVGQVVKLPESPVQLYCHAGDARMQAWHFSHGLGSCCTGELLRHASAACTWTGTAAANRIFRWIAVAYKGQEGIGIAPIPKGICMFFNFRQLTVYTYNELWN